MPMVFNARFYSRKPASFLSIVSVLTLFLMVTSSQDRFLQVFLPGDTVITAELAVTDEERGTGLMFRKKINPDQGMLFVFEQEGIHPIWMKNMRFSIDILWLDEDKRIIHIEQRVPPCVTDDCPTYENRAPSKYVLELKEGRVEAHALELFDRIDFILEDDFRR